ncbi:MAG: universal stress protein [Pseudomonadota bacterium]
MLVGVAGTPSLPSKIEMAIDLAQRHKASITVASVVDADRLSVVGPAPIGAAKYARDLVNQRLNRSRAIDGEAIAEFEAAAAKAGVPLHVVREEGAPMDVLARLWRYHDLLVLGVRGWFDYDVLPDPKNALLKLVARGVRPILAVTEQGRPVKRMAIALNGSLESAKAMKRSLQMAPWGDVEIDLICIDHTKTGETPQKLLADAAAYCALYGVKPTMHHVNGDILTEVLRRADDIDADLIVIGGSYRKILLSNHFGSHVVDFIKHSKRSLFLAH